MKFKFFVRKKPIAVPPAIRRLHIFSPYRRSLYEQRPSKYKRWAGNFVAYKLFFNKRKAKKYNIKYWRFFK